MDRRQKKTKRAILTAFEQLISEKRYNDITIQEIIDLADEGRTTFYAHYETKESLLDALCTELFAHAEPSQSAMLTHILYHLREDKNRYSRLFSGESMDIFWNRFGLLFRQELDKQSQTGWWQTNTDLPDDLY